MFAIGTFTAELEKAWLGIEDIEVTYDTSMDEIRRKLLVALFDKYQWTILLLPFPELSFTDEIDGEQRKLKWSDVADGALLPVKAFAVEHHDPQEELPTLIYTHDLRIKASVNKLIFLFRASKEGAAWFCHYRQDEDGLKIVSNREIAFTDGLLSDAWLLPLYHINMKDGVQGRRCLVLPGLKHHVERGRLRPCRPLLSLVGLLICKASGRILCKLMRSY